LSFSSSGDRPETTLASAVEPASERREIVMTASPDALHGYHLHIYYNENTQPIALKLRDTLAADFPVQIGKNMGIAGPHPVPQIQIIFKSDAFQRVVPWLMLNREGLDILVHPLSDDEYDDHTANALWLGTPVALKLDTLPHGPYPASLLPAA
jgi:aromatic ring-cleaving dioxygenase